MQLRSGGCSDPVTVQMLDDEPFEALKPTLEELLANKDKNKQRAAAEFIAGIICGECLNASRRTLF